jgi:hypothetical protein
MLAGSGGGIGSFTDGYGEEAHAASSSSSGKAQALREVEDTAELWAARPRDGKFSRAQSAL